MFEILAINYHPFIAEKIKHEQIDKREIKGFLDNLYYNYYAYGLTTAESMNSKYAESTTWAAQVNSYVATIKAS